jgi:UDPglucose 6-dehydrogenase
MKIAVVGTGYVGLVVGACLAETGNDVTCVDKVEAKVRMLRRGRMPIYEPGLEELVQRNTKRKRLTFTTQLTKAVRAAEIVFIAVGTPQGEDGSADLRHVSDVAKEIARAMNGYKVIVDKSTVPVGTAAKVRDIVRRETTHPFSVVSNPEFLKQGAAVEDFLKPDRVVIGAEDDKARRIMQELYAPFTRTGAPVMVMDCASAELCKYAANALLATKISFMNEVANVCELFGADVDEVRRAVGSDRRIGPSFLFPGVGYGGSCFPKDVKAILHFSGEKGYEFKTLKAVEAVNQRQKSRLVDKMQAHFGSLKGKTIALWGLAFKPRTDDMREAPCDHHCREARGGWREGAGVRSRGDEGGQRHLREQDHAGRRQLRGAQGRRRAGHRDGVERVPRARLREDAQAAQVARDFRRAEHLQPRDHEGAGLHLLLDRTLMSRLRGILTDPLLSGRDARLQRAGDDRRDHRTRACGADPYPADRRRRRLEGRHARHPDGAQAEARIHADLPGAQPGQGGGAQARLPGGVRRPGCHQDADLEYSPEEYPQLIELICTGRADAVFGSRFLGRHRVFLFTHYLGNRLLTGITNVLYNTMLSDMETCYKVMRTDVLRSMTLKSDSFGIEPELTAKIFKRGFRVYEVPITYDGADMTRARRSRGATASSRSGCC